MDKALLPAGFHDLLFPDAGKKVRIMTHLSMDFNKYGYESVEPPVIEFENSLFTGAGLGLINQTFRLMDPVSHKMMGVRSDITTQIARIASIRLRKSAKPLRLSYGGDVFRVKGEGLYAERQLTQSGIELVGVDSAAADAEVILVIISVLKSLGLEDITIDFTLPKLVEQILDDMKYDKDEKTGLIEAINKKNIAEIERLTGKNAPILAKLVRSGTTAQDLKNIELPPKSKPLCERLIEVLSLIEASSEKINVTIDLLETGKFSYHTGIGFTVFAKGAKGEIGRGGHYEIDDEGNFIPAVGATIYVNEILRILPTLDQTERVYVPFGTNWNRIKELAGNGRVVICGIEQSEDYRSEAIKHHCNLVFMDGKIVKI